MSSNIIGTVVSAPPPRDRAEGVQLQRASFLETDARQRVNQLIRWTFYLFLMTIPFESVGFFRSEESSFTVSRILGLAFAAISLTQPRTCFAKPPLPFWLFSIYLFVTCVLGLFGNRLYGTAVVGYVSTLVQNLLLFWLSANILRDRRVVTGTLLATGLSCSLLSIVMTLGIATREIATLDGKRISLGEADPNGLAFVLIIGLLSLIGLAYVREQRFRAWTFLLLIFYVPLIRIIVMSGSRAAIASLGIGVGLLLLKTGGGKIKTAFFMSVLIAVMGWQILNSEMLMSRWRREMSDGGLGQRRSISLSALSMIVDRPIFGWGPINHLVELSNREGYEKQYRDTHNDLLWAFASTGIVGGVPFLLATWLCLRSAWSSRKGTESILPLALILVMCVMSLSVTLHKRKIVWVLMAYAVASGASVAADTRRLQKPFAL